MKYFKKLSVSALAVSLLVTVSLLVSTPVHAIDFSGYYAGYNVTGTCSYASTEASAKTEYANNRKKTVTVIAYASYSGHYFQYGTNYASANASASVSTSLAISSPYTGVGAKGNHVVYNAAGTSSWGGTSTSGYYE